MIGDFYKDSRCEMVIVSEGGFEVQEGFVVIVETVVSGSLVVGDVSECVVESAGAVKKIDQLKLLLTCR